MLWRRVLSLIYPYQCILCNTDLPLSSSDPVCSSCKEKIIFLDKETTCKICGKPLSSGVCEECEQGKNHFDLLRSVALYEGQWREIIHHYKYKGKFYLSKSLGEHLFQTYTRNEEFQESDFIIPVPEHFLDRIKRGYHQTYLLAKFLGKKTGKRVITEFLCKPKKIPSQTGLPANERKRNVKGAYKVRPNHKLKGSKVLLIDDVFTTGATINECSRVLKRNGVKKIYALTLARGE